MINQFLGYRKGKTIIKVDVTEYGHTYKVQNAVFRLSSAKFYPPFSGFNFCPGGKTSRRRCSFDGPLA